MKIRSRGITLMELMVVLAVLAILVSIAFPTYFEQVRRTRRADAMTVLTELANLQERRFTQTFAYASVLGTGAGGLNHSGVSPDGYYNLSLVSSVPTSYTLTATANPPQDKDTGCTTLTLDSTGAKAPATCWKR